MCRTRSWVQILSSHNVSVIMTAGKRTNAQAETSTPAMAKTEQKEHLKHSKPLAPEPLQPSDTPITHPSPTEPNIMHILDDA